MPPFHNEGPGHAYILVRERGTDVTMTAAYHLWVENGEASPEFGTQRKSPSK